MARYLPKLSVTSEQCRVSRPQFPQSTHGTPGTMTPLLARKTVAFYGSGFPTEARVMTIRIKHYISKANLKRCVLSTDLKRSKLSTRRTHESIFLCIVRYRSNKIIIIIIKLLYEGADCSIR